MRHELRSLEDSWADLALNTKEHDMLMLTQWTTRVLTEAQLSRLLVIWSSVAADMAADPTITRLCHFQLADASGGFSVYETGPADATLYARMSALHEYLDIRVSPVITLEEAMAGLAVRSERYAA
jgi:hypothetical protein